MTYTVTSGSELTIDSRTLAVGGPAATVNRTLVFLAPGATRIEGLSQALGDIITSVFSHRTPAAPPMATNGGGPVAFVGSLSTIAEQSSK